MCSTLISFVFLHTHYSKTFNRVILYQLQNDRLQGKREWTCSELEDMGMGGGFNDQECYFAQEIAIRVCNCQPLDFQPKVEQTPVCEFCPGGDSPTRPDKLVSTNLIGDLTCQGKSFFNIDICIDQDVP